MQLDAWQKCESFMKKNGMLEGVRSVIVGLSGGSDSVFLLYLLKKIAAKNAVSVRAIHVHHGIRGAEADRDAEFVESLCMKESIPCSIVKRNIPEEARKKHMTLEEAGRAARMEIFDEALRTLGEGAVIALAHQKNDVAETLILNLTRGTGLKGLGSVVPVRGPYIRPLLAVTKEEIESALHEEGIPWVVDSTNKDDDAARNRVRHHILPYMEQELNAQTISHIAQTACIAREAADFIEAEAVKRYALYAASYDSGLILFDKLMEEPALMQEEVTRLAVGKLLTSLKDFSGLHVQLILDLFAKPSGKMLNMPKGLIVQRIHGGIYIFCKGNA